MRGPEITMVQPVPGPAGRREPAPRTVASQRIAQILRSYPELTARETDEIVRFLRNARYVEIASLTADKSIRRQLDAVIRTHRHELRSRPTELFAAAALIILFIASILLLWTQFG